LCMQIITDRKKILSLQYKLNKRLTTFMPDTSTRKVLVTALSEKVAVNFDSRLKKWSYYQDNISAHQFMFFVGNWKFGEVSLPCSGTINISWTGSTTSAGVFATKDEEVFLLHSGDKGGKKLKDFFDKYKGEVTNDVEGEDRQYAIVGNMADPDIASKVVHFFDF
jgi:hypothetical protein